VSTQLSDADESGRPPAQSASTSSRDVELVAEQVGRAPRDPWRVAARCRWGYATAIVSPSRLSDGTPFPTFAWLTCPWLAQRASAAESQGATAEWARRAEADPDLRSRLSKTDQAVRERRAAESGGTDACASVGIAGQRDSSGVKCLHAHVALALVGLDDPIGLHMLGMDNPACPDQRCARLIPDASQHGGDVPSEEDA